MTPLPCTCKPGQRCQPCRERGIAHFRFYGIAARFHGDIREVRKSTNPVEWANQQTSYHDCRVALCLAMGVDIVDIDPCTGHDLSARRAAQLSLFEAAA